jgi:xylitol oxidase
MTEQRNWAGNLTYRAARWHEPRTVEQVQDLIRSSRKLRVVGSRHSFNDIADTTEDMISLEHFDSAMTLDRERGTVTVSGGVRYGELGQYLHGEGYALHNLASLPHISVAGACATATHGSGEGNGNLATAVAGLEIVTGEGEVVELTRARDGDRFHGAVVGLGGLGVVTKITLDIAPTFDMWQDVYESLPLSQLEAHFDEIVSGAYSVSLFTDWQSEQAVEQIWLKRRAVPGEAAPAPVAAYFEAVPATVERHPIIALSAENCNPQLGVRGPWHQRLPHFRMDFTPSSGTELQTEYFVPRQHAVAAMRAIRQIRAQLTPLLMISEVRTIAADNLWMSPCYGQPGVGLHFTWHRDWPSVQQLLPALEAQLAPFEARPHWGKLFSMDPARVRSLYPRLADFQALLRSFDPQGKFRNAFLDTYIFGEG